MVDTGDTQKIPLPPMTADHRWPHLVVINGDAVGMVFDLVRAESVIGRDSNADIRLTDSTVSRRHAVVRVTGPNITIEDLGSRNGTFVDMEQVKGSRSLKDGDHVSLGNATVLKVTYAVSADAAVRRAGFDNATRDPETLVSSMFHLLDRLRGDLAYARRHGEALTLVFFRVVREQLEQGEPGSLVDHTLRDVAKIIREAMRADELLARASGADLVAVVRSDESQASGMAARMKARAAESAPSAAETPSAGILLAAAIVPLATTEVAEPEAVMTGAHQRAREIFGQRAHAEEATARLSMSNSGSDNSNGEVS